MTRQQFDALPLLLTGRQARELFNCSQGTLDKLRDNYPRMAMKMRGQVRWLYHKRIVAEIIKLDE